MAAATHFTKNIDKYKDIFKYTVNGQTKNVFSKGDLVLHLYSLSELQFCSLGRNNLILS